MIYHEFGNTGVRISSLGFGTMRFPMVGNGVDKAVDEETSIMLIRRAYELGVNYFDSGYGYCLGQSEKVLGKALKGIRDDLYISTKFPYWGKTDRGEYRRILEEQLEKLGTDHIDFYHFHGIDEEGLNGSILKNGFMEEAHRAKSEGLIDHISFSFHDRPDALVRIADTGYFETLLCQYNFIDRSNEEAMAHARSRGIGVAVMGPVAGGRIAGMPGDICSKTGIDTSSSAALALRFVLSNPDVDCALSGMNSVGMVEENCMIASSAGKLLREKEIGSLTALMDGYKKLSELYCTGCNYCMPCPQGVNIPYIFQLMNYYRIYGIREYSRSEYANIGTTNGIEGMKADKCIGCGECETKCPQKIRIIEQLGECAKALG